MPATSARQPIATLWPTIYFTAIQFAALMALGWLAAVRDGVRATARGEDPKGLTRDGDEIPIPTYCHNTVLRVPPAPTEAAEQAQRIAFGRRIFERIRAGELTKDRPGAARPDGRN